MKLDKPEQKEGDDGFALPDPVMDAALTSPGYPGDERLTADFEAWRTADPKHVAAHAEVSDVWCLNELDVIAADLERTAGTLTHTRLSTSASVGFLVFSTRTPKAGMPA